MKKSLVALSGAIVYFGCAYQAFGTCVVLLCVFCVFLYEMICRNREMEQGSACEVDMSVVSPIMERHKVIESLRDEVLQKQQKLTEDRLKKTEEYTQLIFTLSSMSVEDVEKVCEQAKLFIETGQVSTDKSFRIQYNRALRNPELKQYVLNIIRYNEKDALDAELFLMTVFEEWFRGKKENISKNYNTLPKDSIVSKDGVEKDLERLRGMLNRN